MSQYKGSLSRSGQNLSDSNGNVVGKLNSDGRGTYLHSGEDMGEINYHDSSYEQSRQANNSSTNYDVFDGNGTPSYDEFHGDSNTLISFLKVISFFILLRGIMISKAEVLIPSIYVSVIIFGIAKALQLQKRKRLKRLEKERMYDFD